MFKCAVLVVRMALPVRLLNRLEHLLAKVVGTVLWPPTSVAVLVETDDGEVLALNFLGRYELPGGLVKAEEGLREAGKREVKEETGFTVELGDLLDIRDGNGPGIHYFFEGTIVDGEKDGSWEGKPVFIPKEEIRDRLWRLHHAHVHEYLFPDEQPENDAMTPEK